MTSLFTVLRWPDIKKRHFRGGSFAQRKAQRVMERHIDLIEAIGLARFVGRINAGVIDAATGYAAVSEFVRRSER